VVKVIPRTLYLQERILGHVEQEAVWVPEPVCTFCSREKSLVPPWGKKMHKSEWRWNLL
jgi:hypothetical protein